MGYIRGDDRDQVQLLPEQLDDYVGADDEVRVIERFVEAQDMAALGFHRAVPADEGRPGYDPKDLLKLWIYGYLNGIRSSRRLAKEAGRNLQVIWLMRRLQPDFNTLARFRRGHDQALKQLFGAFTRRCAGLGLVAGELVAIDGSRFAGDNNRNHFYTRQGLRQQLSRLDEQIERYMDDLEDHDQADDAGEGELQWDGQRIREVLDELDQRKADLEDLLKDMDDHDDPERGGHDPQARRMRSRDGQVVGYNLQASVDGAYKLLVEAEVTNKSSDKGQLAAMAQASQAACASERLTVLADAGYHNGAQFERLEGTGITAYVPDHATTNRAQRGLFTAEQFHYDPERDCYWCPAGEPLYWRARERRANGSYRDQYQARACHQCRWRSQCTSNQRGRTIWRPSYQDYIEAMRTRVQAHPGLIQQRKQLCEHPFGTIKHSWGFRRFTTRGHRAVRAEAQLSCLAYNLRRAINVLGPRRLAEAMG